MVWVDSDPVTPIKVYKQTVITTYQDDIGFIPDDCTEEESSSIYIIAKQNVLSNLERYQMLIKQDDVWLSKKDFNEKYTIVCTCNFKSPSNKFLPIVVFKDWRSRVYSILCQAFLEQYTLSP
jgi:hypothetical protein